MSTEEQTAAVTRCFAVETENYCLGLGFTDSPEGPRAAAVAAEQARRAQGSKRTTAAEETGDLALDKWVAKRVAMRPEVRVAAEQAELARALDVAGKVTDLKAFLKAEKARTKGVFSRDLPPQYLVSNQIIGNYKTRQEQSNWCGVATLQSFDWSDDGVKDAQSTLATALGTTSDGTWIGNLTNQINSRTAWDNKAGSYLVQSISPLDATDFYNVHRYHLGDADPAPIVEHPQLTTANFSYLHHDHGGHFQVGRGYYTNANGNRIIQFFEVFNEADFSSVGYTTWGAREVTSAAMLRATKLNVQQNIGL